MALCIVTAVDMHTHRKVGTQSFRSKGSPIGLRQRGCRLEHVTVRIDPDNRSLVPVPVPPESMCSHLKVALRGVSRGIRQFREGRLVQFNFTLIYSVSALRRVARFSL